MPKPFQIDGCVLWDVTELDAAFDLLKTGSPQKPKANSFEDVA